MKGARDAPDEEDHREYHDEGPDERCGRQPSHDQPLGGACRRVATLSASSLYYGLLGGVYQSLRPDPSSAIASPQVWEVGGQLVRNVVEILAIAWIMQRLRIATCRGAVGLGLVLWLGFQAMAVAGSVLHEHYPLGLFALHIGDALMTTLISVLMLHAWRRR